MGTAADHKPRKRRGVVAYGGLVVCTLCMCAAAQLIQLSKRHTGQYKYSYYTLNTLVEGTKLVVSLGMLVIQRRRAGGSGVIAAFKELPTAMWPRYAIPAGIYLINNNVYYVILYYMDAATFQVVMSLKIVATGLLMNWVLGRRLSGAQWLALVVLSVGSVTAQLEQQAMAGSGAARRASTVGFTIACGYCLLSGFAGVATEALLKGAHSASIHACNVLLYSYGFVFNLVAFWTMERSGRPFLAGITGLTLVIVANSAVMGMIISAIMKHFDNIVKVYLNSVAIVLSIGVSMATADFNPSWWFGLSVVLVSASAVAYSRDSWGPLAAVLGVEGTAKSLGQGHTSGPAADPTVSKL